MDKQKMIDRVFGKEENWTKREKELYVRIRPDLLDAIIRAGSWDQVSVPSDRMEDLKQSTESIYQTSPEVHLLPL